MSKKKNKPALKPDRVPAVSNHMSSESPALDILGKLGETIRHPLLVLAWISTALAVLAIVLAIRFRNDLTVGTISDPASAVVWGAVALTCFARYWRERIQAKRSP